MIHTLLNYARGGLLAHMPPAQPLMWLFYYHYFLVELDLLEMCIRWEPLARGAVGKVQSPETTEDVGARSPHGPAEAEGGHCGGGCGNSGCPVVFSELRFQGPPRASGLQDFPGFSAQRNRLGESLRATRPRLLHWGQCAEDNYQGFCDSETLWMGQWVPPS